MVRFSIVWQTDNQFSADTQAVLRSYQANGTASSDEVHVSDDSDADQGYPAIAIDSSGRRIVAWRDGRPNWLGGSDGDLHHRLFDASSAALSAEQTKNLSIDYWSGPDIGVLQNSIYALGSSDRSSSQTDVRGNFYAAAAPLQAVLDTVSTTVNAAKDIDVTANDVNPAGGGLTLAVSQQPTFGSVVVNDNNVTWSTVGRRQLVR